MGSNVNHNHLAQSNSVDRTPTRDEITAQMLAEYYARERAKYGLVPMDADAQTEYATTDDHTPLRGSRLDPTVAYSRGLGRVGIKGNARNIDGYANFGFNKDGPQDVDAGISGSMGRVGAHIPLFDPAGLTIDAETSFKGNALSASMTPKQRAFLLQINRGW
jgi:hypothetical protein